MADNLHLDEELQPKPLRLDEPFVNTRQANLSRATIGDFWLWAYSDIANNTNRGILAEYIVAKALGSMEKVRVNWAIYDVDSRRGARVEVKSAAHLQSWPQEKPSTVRFDIAKVRGWDDERGEYIDEPQRHAEVYIFCLLAYEEDKRLLNPLDLSQWEFYVVPISRLDQEFDDYKSLGLTRVQELSRAYRVDQLSRAVSAALSKGQGS